MAEIAVMMKIYKILSYQLMVIEIFHEIPQLISAFN